MSISSPLAPRADPAQLPASTTVSFNPEGIVDAKHKMGTEDSRSSSLSDIGIGKNHDILVESPLSEESDSNDTEAETERLEESPEKVRKQQNVVLASAAALPNRSMESHTLIIEESNGNMNCKPQSLPRKINAYGIRFNVHQQRNRYNFRHLFLR